MSTTVRLGFAALAAVAIAAAMPGVARTAEYDFTIIASEGFFDFGCPEININGWVAFKGSRDNGVTAIWRGNGTRRVLIVKDTDSEIGFLGSNPSLNDRQEVAFAATLSEGEAIFRGNGGALTEIARTEPGPFSFFGFDTSMNIRNEVAFTGELDNFDEGLFVGSGGPVETIYLASESKFAGASSRPSINDAGQIAFFEFLDAGGQGIFRFDPEGDRFVTIATSRGPLDFPGDPTVNNSGLVAFRGFMDDFEVAILKGRRSRDLRTVADTTGPFSFFDDPSLNNLGDVAFTAALDTGEQAVFAGPDPVADRVLGTGDTLDGSTVASVRMCHEGLNDVGQLAFSAQFEGGRVAVVRATPSGQSLGGADGT